MDFAAKRKLKRRVSLRVLKMLGLYGLVSAVTLFVQVEVYPGRSFATIYMVIGLIPLVGSALIVALFLKESAEEERPG